MSGKSEGTPGAIPIEKTRRDFLYVATAATGAVGAAATLVPLISQLSPDAATLAAGAPIDIDVSKLQPGQQVAIAWRGSPVIGTVRAFSRSTKSPVPSRASLWASNGVATALVVPLLLRLS